MNKLFTTSFHTKKVNDESREIDFVASKEVRDRQQEVVEVAGINLKNFKLNPIILWAHDHSGLPIGKATKITKSGDELKVRIQFADASVYSFADTVFKLISGGYLNALSIGFQPDYKQVVYDEKNNSRIFKSVELLEISVVPVPANQTALISKAVDTGIVDELEFKEFISTNLEAVIKSPYITDTGALELTDEEKNNRIDELEVKVVELQNQMTENKSYVEGLFVNFRKGASADQAKEASRTEEDYTEEDMQEIMDFFEYKNDEEKS